jgi:hypothetical protein
VLRNPKKLGGLTIGDAEQRAREAAASLNDARRALQEQENVLELMLSRGDEIKAIHALDRSGRRAAAFAAIPDALEANRALQQKLAALTASPSSKRLEDIQRAIHALQDAPKGMTLKQKLGGAAAFAAVMGGAGAAASAVGVSIPGEGYMLPILGAAAGSAVAAKLGGAVAKTNHLAKERTAKAVEAFAAGARGARKVVPVLASRVLAETRFAPDEGEEKRRQSSSKAAPTLIASFEARSKELGRIVVPGPNGKPTVRPEERRKIADRLSPIAQTAPHLADRLETHAVKRIVFLDSKRPRSVRIGMTTIPPSEMAVRAWARYVAAADDPGAIEERLADGTVTPEDAEVMRELYPERMAEITRQIVEKMATLRGTLPLQRRLSLSMFTGAPVDASLEPRILAQLQSVHAAEPGTEGGTQAPRPRPAFGSVKKPDPTPAQSRAG